MHSNDSFLFADITPLASSATGNQGLRASMSTIPIAPPVRTQMPGQDLRELVSDQKEMNSTGRRNKISLSGPLLDTSWATSDGTTQRRLPVSWLVAISEAVARKHRATEVSHRKSPSQISQSSIATLYSYSTGFPSSKTRNTKSLLSCHGTSLTHG
jgi:hypothetical protein